MSGQSTKHKPEIHNAICNCLTYHMNVDEYKDYTREQLVEEYLETRLASLVNWCSVDRRWMPKDVSKDPNYWKSKDKDLHDMHYEIARRYHIKRDDCLWLENLMDSTNLYVTAQTSMYLNTSSRQ